MDTKGKENKTIDEKGQENRQEKKTKIKKERCHFCNKKLKMINFTCRCNHKFCINHQSPHSHNCTYDFKKEKQNEIKKNNPIIQTKVQKI